LVQERRGRAAGFLRHFPAISSIAVAGVGSLALAGWLLDQPVLKGVMPGLVAMNPMTAMCFILAGASLLLLHREPEHQNHSRIGKICGCVVAFVGFVKLGGILLGWDSGIDRMLFSAKLDTYVPPNRMAPNTALNFLLSGLALALADAGSVSGRRPSKYLALAPLLLSFLAVTGYAYEVRPFYGLVTYIPMALNTALAFLLLCAGTLLLHPDQGLTKVFASDDLGGSLARRLFPISVGALLLLGWLRLLGEGVGLYDTNVGVSLHVFVACVLIGTVIWTSARSLSRVDAERRRAAEALQRAHDGLEVRVQERTAELVGAQGALRKSEEQLRQAQKMEAIGRLAGGVAHDFNNMLTAILGHSQLMRMRMSPEDRAYRDTEEIEKAAKRAGSLTRQLLAFSRQQVLEPKILDLNALIEDMDKMLRRLIGADVDLLTAPGSSLGRVKADPGQVEQVLLNLVVNARDAMPGGGKITIETANVDLDETYTRAHPGVRPGPYVLLAVSDTGCGIDPETRTRIFEPFFTTKEAGKGTGLGLSTVYGVVQQSEGHVDVHSDVGHGATFKIYLPRIEQSLSETAAPSRPAAAAGRGLETVLLVEDEDQVRSVVRLSLELFGYRVLESRDGREALDLLERADQPVDLVVTDVMMPRMTGPEFAQRAFRLNPDLKILFISGYTDKAIVHHGILSPGTAYLQKPFAPDVLGRKVREVLDGPQAEVA
jgi:signal transduction histidine kinase/CheY-like chemotaxis protein